MRLAKGGQKVDNLIFIGSPISTGSDLYKKLTSNRNIGNVIVIDVVGDNVSGVGNKSVGEKKKVGGDLISRGDSHPHLRFSNDAETRRIIAHALKEIYGIQ